MAKRWKFNKESFVLDDELVRQGDLTVTHGHVKSNEEFYQWMRDMVEGECATDCVKFVKPEGEDEIL